MSVSEKNSSIWSVLQNARVYASFQTLLPRQTKKQFAEEVLAFKDGEKVLDVGCGPAAILSNIDAGIDYYGLDPNPDYIRHARETHGDRATLFQTGIQEFDMPEQYGTFDHVIALGVLHHLDDESASQMVSFSAKMLKPGGRLLTVDPGRTSPQNPIARFLVNNDRGQHVRFPEDHEALFGEGLSSIDLSIRTDRMRIPYTHFIVTAYK